MFYRGNETRSEGSLARGLGGKYGDEISGRRDSRMAASVLW